MIREYIIKISDEIMEEEIADRPQELVRCKYCKYWLPMNRFVPDYHPGRGQCELNCWVRDFDWFCGDGKKRNDS